MKMMLSELITKLEIISNDGKHPKTKTLVGMLKQNLAEKGDIEVDVYDLCEHFGIKI